MTREQAKAIAPFMKAWGDGEDIEVRIDGQWHPSVDPQFTNADIVPDLRIKPKPREWWIRQFPTGYQAVYRTKRDADKEDAISIQPLIHVREVLP